MQRNDKTPIEPLVPILIKVKVYLTRFKDRKRRFQYSKRFCSIEEAKEYIKLREDLRIKFDNFMGYCRLDRQDFKLSIKG